MSEETKTTKKRTPASKTAEPKLSSEAPEVTPVRKQKKVSAPNLKHVVKIK